MMNLIKTDETAEVIEKTPLLKNRVVVAAVVAVVATGALYAMSKKVSLRITKKTGLLADSLVVEVPAETPSVETATV